jgi:hypothetical protein
MLKSIVYPSPWCGEVPSFDVAVTTRLIEAPETDGRNEGAGTARHTTTEKARKRREGTHTTTGKTRRAGRGGEP